MTTLLGAALCLAAAYAGIVAFMYVRQRALMYPAPTHTPPNPAQAGAERLAVVTYETEDGLTLRGWFRAAGAGQPTIVYFQGNAGHIAERAFKSAPWLDAGYGVLYAGYRGYGGNSGSPSEQGLARDADAAMAFVARNGAAAGDVVLYGESLGTGVATALAHRLAGAGTPVRGLILETPFTSMADAAAVHYPWLPVRLLIKDTFDIAGRVGAVAAPVLVLHGTADRVVPFAHGKAVFDAAAEPKSVAWFEGGDHTDLDDFGAGDAVARFLDGLSVR
jgi:fermentation-respiration switch protein FrsA (DUF1100 family)